MGRHHDVSEFDNRGREPAEEVQIYTWPDVTLRELGELVKEVVIAARMPHARLSFAFVYPDRRGRNVIRVVGKIDASPGHNVGDDDEKTLASLSFETGDFLSVCVLNQKDFI